MSKPFQDQLRYAMLGKMKEGTFCNEESKSARLEIRAIELDVLVDKKMTTKQEKQGPQREDGF